MDIQNYIAAFLLTHDKLHFPGLGTIVIVHSGANVEKARISPPGSELVFTSEENADEENHFAGYLAEQENISDEEAMQRFLEFIDEIKFAFNKTDSFTIPGVCTLALDEDNNVNLEQDRDFIADPEYYGLESFEIDSLRDAEEDERDSGEKETEPEERKDFYSEKMGWVLDEEQDMHKFEETYIRGSANNVRKFDKREEKEEQSATEKESQRSFPDPPPPPPPPVSPAPPGASGKMKRKGRRRGLRIALTITGIVILIIAAFILIPVKTEIFTNDIDFHDIFGSSGEMEVNDNFSDVKDEEFDFDEMVDGLGDELDSSARMENALGMPEESSEKAASVDGDKEEYIEYHIIAGSFRDYENARELQQELTLMGYPSLIIEPGNGIYRVSAISFRDKVTALNELVAFREKTGLSTAWLMNLE